MKERPILFSAAMVRAILEGRKTQTRRVWKKQPYKCSSPMPHFSDTEVGDLFICPDMFPTEPGPVGVVIAECTSLGAYHCMGQQSFVEKHGPKAYGVPGDRLWVRETHLQMPTSTTPEIMYADDEDYDVCIPMKYEKLSLGWRVVPSIHMPRWASRITLEITDVRVQRVQEISSADAADEGVEPCKNCVMLGRAANCECPVQFRKLWDSINGKTYPWANNDWVWALTFKVRP